MNILAIDTSTEACCVMAINGNTISTLIEKQPRKHNEVILDLITNALDNVKLLKTEIDFLALDKGTITENEVVKQLINTMESYTNGGLTLIKEQYEDNSNYFLTHEAFLNMIKKSKTVK